jgi:ribonuclease P protein subunit POP4
MSKADQRRSVGGGSAGAALQEKDLYASLATVLGGGADDGARPRDAALSVGSLLPVPRGVKIPADDVLHGRLRNRTLLLDKETGASSAAPDASKRPRSRWSAEGRGTGSRAIVSREATKRARSSKVVIPKEEQRYEIYEPLAKMWQDYAEKVVGNGSMASAGDRLLRMDLHGAEVEVVRARDPNLVGIRGILILETANTVLVATRRGRVVTVPKNAVVVCLHIGAGVFEFALPMLPYRASERSARKVKKRHMALF